MKTYEQRVQKYEDEGCTRSDAQAIVDAEDMRHDSKGKIVMNDSEKAYYKLNKGKTTQKHAPGPWEAKPASLNVKDPLFYKADVICGGIRVAQVAGVGEDC